MNAGKYRHRVTIQAPTRTPNSVGEMIMTWADTHPIWCNIRPVTAREIQRSQQPLVDCDHIIEARWNNWLQTDYRLKWARNGKTTQYFNITGIVNVNNRNEELEIQATRTTDASV